MSETPHLVARRRELRELVGRLTGAGEDALDRTAARVESFVKRQSYGSVDPRSVVERLDGLVEKFEVVGRRDLSMVLRGRAEQVQELAKALPPKQSDALFQVLLLVMELPGSPLAQKELPVLELPIADDRSAEKEWKWSEIVAEDPLTGDHWEDLDDTSSLSAWSDEDVEFEDVEKVDETLAAALANMTLEQNPIPIEKFAISRSKSILDSLNSVDQGNGRIAEANVLKECILMLQGLPSVLFCGQNETVTVVSPLPYELSHLSSEILTSTLKLYAKTGTLIAQLRAIIDDPDILGIPPLSGILEQFCSLQIEPNLEFLLTQLLNDPDEFVSLIRVYTMHLTPLNGLLNPLLETLRSVESAPQNNRIVHALDTLYDGICRLQLACANPLVISVLAQLFSAAFDEYSVQINEWISYGKASPGFFIDSTDGSGAPTFLSPFTKSIRLLGDYTHLIKQLPKDDESLPQAPTNQFATNPIPESTSFLSFSDQLFHYLQHEMINYSRDLELSLYDALMFHGFLHTFESICEVYLIQDPKGIISDFIYTLCDSGADISTLSRHTIDYHLDQAIERYEQSLPSARAKVSIEIAGCTASTVLLSTTISKPLASTIFTKSVISQYTFVYRFLFKSMYALKRWTFTESNQSKFYRLSSVVTALQLFISSQIRDFKAAISSPVDIYKLHDDFLASIYNETLKYVKIE